MATTKSMTAEDLAALPDDGYRYELVSGGLVRMPPPGFRHSRVVYAFTLLLGGHVDEQGLGVVGNECGFRLSRDPDHIRAPDIYFLRADRVPPEEGQDGYLDLAPDLAVEVLSPSDSLDSLAPKVHGYLAAGARQVLVLDPRHRTVTAFGPHHPGRTLTEDEDLDLDEVVHTFRVRVADLIP